MVKRLFGLILLLSCMVLASEAGMAGEPSRVVIVPFKMNAERDLSFLKEGIVDMLTSRLSWGDREVVGREDTDHVLADISEPVNEEIAQTIGSRLQADHVLFGSLTIFGNSISLDARMVDVQQKRSTLTFFKQSKAIDEVIPQIDLLAAQINETVFGRPVGSRRPPAQVGQPPAAYVHPESLLAGKSSGQAKALRPGPGAAAGPGPAESGGVRPADPASAAVWKSRSFKAFIKGIALGDVDGDSKTEVVFISNRHVYVYRYENKKFSKIGEMAGKRYQEFIGVDVGDINGNGCEEIFVTSLKGTGQRLDSLVLEWDDDALKRISEDDSWYYRVTESPEGDKILLGQKRRMDDPFVSGVYQLAWRNGEYGPEERLALPKRVNIFGFALGDVMNNGRQVIVAFDKGAYIQILTPSGEKQWESDESYGGSMNYLEFIEQAGEVDTERLYLPQRIFIRDLDRDGRHEIVVASNELSRGQWFKRLRNFKHGHIECLSWTGHEVAVNWQTPQISGHISDYAIGDLDQDGRDELVAAAVGATGSALSSAKSLIIGYELIQPASSGR